MGTPDFAVWSLKRLANKFPIAQVVTNPDRPAGRGMKLTPSPVKAYALAQGLPVTDDLEAFLRELRTPTGTNNPLFIVVAYGKILPAELVNHYSCINLHASLLPKYRGASPIQSALLNGDPVTGVTTMRITEKMDTGPILLSKEVSISENETLQALHDQLADAGAELLADTIARLNTLTPQPQDDAHATYCKKIKKEDRLLDLSWDYRKIHNTVRAIGGYFFDQGKRINIVRTILKPQISVDPPAGTSSRSAFSELDLLAHYLDIRVKPEGKHEMALGEYLKGRRELS